MSNPNPKLPSDLSSHFSPWEGSSVSVRQGRHWSSALIWLTSSLFGVSLIWAFNSRIDQTISVRGRLQPLKSVTIVESPSSGVVQNLHVSDGDIVNLGDPLLTFEAKGLSSKKDSLTQSLSLISFQSSALQSIISNKDNLSLFKLDPLVAPSDLSADSDFQDKVDASRNQTLQLKAQLDGLDSRIKSRQQSLILKTQIAEDLLPVYESGAMSRNGYLQQLNSIQELKADIATLSSERSRIIGVATSQLNNLNRQALNLRSELDSVNELIGYKTIHAPASGRIFDLKASNFSVVGTSESLLKIVPIDNLQALIEIPNSDIGFVKVGQKVSVAVDSFPSGEFGYIKGQLITLGSDSLPPDSDSPQIYFPGIVKLDQQSVFSGNQKLNLQSGMSISANIKLRSRQAITILTDLFTRQMDGIKQFR